MSSPELIGNHKRWIWPFELLERIGEGGMGEVYRARFVKNDRIVALKLLPSDVTNETILARFEREMKILRSLRHPNIVHCFGGACEGDEQFYAMELVEGGTLSDLLRRQGRLSVDRVIAYGKQMCAALMYAHERGVIHRDLKPGNFLVAEDGHLKLSDFGLATIAAGRKITADDRTVGTFLYMAPEQITGKPPVSPQTDLYALGCVLFELLSGSPPFQGETAGEVLHKHLGEPPEVLASVVMSCPAELNQLVMQLLEKKPDDRPASAADVAKALNNFGNSVTVIERRPPLITQKSPEKKGVVPTATPKPDVGVSSVPSGWTRWLLPVCVVLIGVLFVRNRWLAGKSAAFDRTEKSLIATFEGGESPTRVLAAPLLAELAADSSDAVDALVRGLDDEDPLIRRAAAEALGKAGPAAWSARHRLRKSQRNDDRPYVRTAAGESLEIIQSSPPETRWWAWITGAVLAAVAVLAFWFRHHFRSVAAKLESTTPG